MSGHKAGQWTDLCEQSNLVDLGNYGIKYFSFERPEHNRLGREHSSSITLLNFDLKRKNKHTEKKDIL